METETIETPLAIVARVKEEQRKAREAATAPDREKMASLVYAIRTMTIPEFSTEIGKRSAVLATEILERAAMAIESIKLS